MQRDPYNLTGKGEIGRESVKELHWRQCSRYPFWLLFHQVRLRPLN